MKLDEIVLKALLECLEKHKFNKTAVADELGITNKTIYNILEKNNITVQTYIPEFKGHYKSKDRQAIKDLIRLFRNEDVFDFRFKLSEKEKLIFEERIIANIPSTQTKIAKKLKISRQAISQIENNILSKMKQLTLTPPKQDKETRE